LATDTAPEQEQQEAALAAQRRHHQPVRIPRRPGAYCGHTAPGARCPTPCAPTGQTVGTRLESAYSRLEGIEIPIMLGHPGGLECRGPDHYSQQRCEVTLHGGKHDGDGRLTA
jgi:hypothetical protein